jgi:acyl carrier protein phosphodiesterase
MNFFGHAAVASWSSPAPGTVLGAMLPDFATMVRARLADAEDRDVAAGIAHHHATDAAFHGMPAVLALMRELDERLAALGCARGPRRAVAHIGVELLLDGVLVDEAAYREAYAGGLARLVTLLSRLRAHGVPDDLRRPHAITQRLHRMLAHRPLLAPAPADLVAIDRALVAYQPRVEAAADTVLRGLR